ncbi:MAG TPA: Crp/Fnr family transcriptional regulator [Propionicimonas sp.]|nr:Crp/Fnr family transcriptional regulator [Propionicimonas sp.]
MRNSNHALANLRLLLEAYANCELPQWEFFASNLRTVRLPAGGVLFDVGETHPYLNFVHRGLMKAVTTDEKGRSSTVFFAQEGDVLASMSALGTDGIRRVASRGLHSRSHVLAEALEQRTLLAAVAVEPTQLFQSGFKVVEHLAGQHLPWARLMYTIALMQATLQQADLTWIRRTPEQRYLRVLAEHPDMVRRVTQRDLAAYLNITEAALSRIAKRVRNSSEDGGPAAPCDESGGEVLAAVPRSTAAAGG